jgi:hypothetical protein
MPKRYGVQTIIAKGFNRLNSSKLEARTNSPGSSNFANQMP